MASNSRCRTCMLLLMATVASIVTARKLGFQTVPCAGRSHNRWHRQVLRAAATDGHAPEKLRFLTPEVTKKIANTFGTPTYVYDMATLKQRALETLAFPNAYGLTVRYAMKASPNTAIIKYFSGLGLNIDASSGFEVTRALRAGIPPNHISLSSQELPQNFDNFVDLGAEVNACSITQLERFGERYPGGKIGLRFNPGLGSGGTGKTNVGGPSSSFGIWHELLDQVKAVVARHELKVVRIHTHIGSGSDPAVWQRVATLSLNLCREFPEVVTLNLGGGYKVGRMSQEVTTDLQKIGEPVKNLFIKFAEETGRELKLEIEPGTYLVANAGALVSTIQDKTETSEHTFLKLDSGMTEVLRPSLYGAQHPLVLVPRIQGANEEKVSPKERSYVVVGHCCESGDLLTPAPGESETISERVLSHTAEVGDYIVIEGAGAYCSGMSTKNYNSFPEAPEVMLAPDGELHLVRRRQTLEQILQNEVDLPLPILASA